MWFDTPAGTVRAVDGISLSVHPGEIVTVVGESGSGKSVVALSALKLIDTPPGRFVAGEVRLGGRNVLEMSEKQLTAIRGSYAAMLFQSPRGSLDPSFTVRAALRETTARHHPAMSETEFGRYLEEALRKVGFSDWERVAASYPHQLSGGMCQRVALAIALACNPRMLIADEPTTALDVGVQARILYHLRELNRQNGLPILLITHDFGVVRAIGHRVVVMYAGHVQEQGTVAEVLNAPLHPYSQALIRSVPENVALDEQLYQIPGTPPNLSAPLRGCRFADRCEAVMGMCRDELPPLVAVSETRKVRCHLHDPAGRAAIGGGA